MAPGTALAASEHPCYAMEQMSDDFFFDPAEHTRRLLSALSEPQFRKYWPSLQSFMSRSRASQSAPVDLLALQAEMARELRGAQESQRKLEKQLAKTSNSQDTVELNSLVGATKRIGYVIRQIADGIAWRALDYDRPLIQVLAMKPIAGQVNLLNTPQELEAAARYVAATGGIALINDLTNVLRYGDWMGIRQDGAFFIGEEKAGKGSRKSGRATRQRQRLRQILEFCRKGVGLTPEGFSQVFVHGVRLKTHLQAIRQLLLDARSGGSAHARLSECVAVDVWHMESVLDDGARLVLHNPFAATSDTVTSHSLLFFDKMSASPAPYSIFPFSDHDCADLMIGATCLIGHFDLGRLFRLFREQGLDVIQQSEDEACAFAELDIGEKRRRRDEIAYRISQPGRPGALLLSGGDIGRLCFEFMHEESLVEAAEESLVEFGGVPAPVAVFSVFPNEREVWE